MKMDMGKKGIKQDLGNKKILTDKAALDSKFTCLADQDRAGEGLEGMSR